MTLYARGGRAAGGSRFELEGSLKRVGLLVTIVFTLSLLGGCIVHTRTGSRHSAARRCPPGKVLVKHHGKWKCKKPKKAKKHHPKKRDHRN